MLARTRGSNCDRIAISERWIYVLGLYIYHGGEASRWTGVSRYLERGFDPHLSPCLHTYQHARHTQKTMEVSGR